MKCHVPLDISKIEIKTKHVLGVKEKPTRTGVAAGTCDEKGFSRGRHCFWRARLHGSPLVPRQRATQGQAKAWGKLVSMSTTADGHQLPRANTNLFQKQKMSYMLPDEGQFVGTGN